MVKRKSLKTLVCKRYPCLVVLFLGGAVLSGCSSYSNRFDCPYGEGLGCASVSRVNRMIEANLVETGEPLLPGRNEGKRDSSPSLPIYFGPNRPSQMMTFQGLPVL